jgi:hypothetical protein
MAHTKSLVLVIKGSCYLGEMEHDDSLDPAEVIKSPGGLQLKNAYEVIRLKLMGPQGPEFKYMLTSIGFSGAMDWYMPTIDGISAVDDGNPLERTYRQIRAEDSGLTLAGAMPPPAVPGLPAPGLPGMPGAGAIRLK